MANFTLTRARDFITAITGIKRPEILMKAGPPVQNVQRTDHKPQNGATNFVRQCFAATFGRNTDESPKNIIPKYIFAKDWLRKTGLINDPKPNNTEGCGIVPHNDDNKLTIKNENDEKIDLKIIKSDPDIEFELVFDEPKCKKMIHVDITRKTQC